MLSHTYLSSRTQPWGRMQSTQTEMVRLVHFDVLVATIGILASDIAILPVVWVEIAPCLLV
jgi:hypothetical protein